MISAYLSCWDCRGRILGHSLPGHTCAVKTLSVKSFLLHLFCIPAKDFTVKTDLLPGGELIASENEQELNQKAECVKDELRILTMHNLVGTKYSCMHIPTFLEQNLACCDPANTDQHNARPSNCQDHNELCILCQNIQASSNMNSAFLIVLKLQHVLCSYKFIHS